MVEEEEVTLTVIATVVVGEKIVGEFTDEVVFVLGERDVPKFFSPAPATTEILTMEGKRNRSDSTAHIQSKKIKISNHHLQTPDLPAEIIQDILLRLPVKSLLKSKCVSKSWLSLISSPQFIKTHLKLSAENADFANHGIIFTITDPRFRLRHCSVTSLMSKPRTVASNVDYPKKNPYRAVWVVGSCNGIICIAIDEKDIFLWNPSTRKTKELPPAGVEMRPGFYYLWGFGYSESDDDYKVVGLFCLYGNGGLQESIVKIYSLRANSWKRIDDFSCGVPFDDTGKFANGKMHFASTPEMDFESRWNIVSLDLKSEGYDILEQPNYGEACSNSTLGLLGGCLSVLCEYQSRRVDLWVLKEYGVKESWTRVVSIPYLHDPGHASYLNPLLIMPNGDVLLVFKTRLVVYSPKDNTLRRPRISNAHNFLEADIYFESLVPL
ncbi:hypothetical protein C2S51_030264 [Perilla frutescens var. frutescens]|nr:hypothetical protein C2S51_030264 [Perilla frutescens var. frutescens]